MRILLTGATGFIGRGLLDRMSTQVSLEPVAVVRNFTARPSQYVATFRVAGIDANTDWQNALERVDAVIHCAARVHVMHDTSSDSLAEFRKVNVDGTLNLARQAASAGVRRFIFISSIKVNGEGTELGKPYVADCDPAPLDPYGVSKMEAEQDLRFLASETGMEVVIIRPVLVYGPGVKANFRSMMNWLNRGVPLPLGAIRNKRSLVALDNLVDLILTCLNHPAAANQTFLVSDGEDLSTSELLQRMGTALGKPARLLTVPPSLLETGATLLGKRAVAQRLCGSLQVDISKTRQLLGWEPPVSIDEAMRRTAKEFLQGSKSGEPR